MNYKNTSSRRAYLLTAIAVLFAAAIGLPSAKAVNIVANGSFETPTVPVGGFMLFASGSNAITDWTVVGPPGTSVAIISGTFTQFGFTFPAQDGVQWLDLTGLNSNTTDGVQQTVATTPGALYDLSFFVGNISNPGGLFGTTSTVGVQINGGPVVSFTNSGGVGSTSQVWQQFTLPFTATAATTSVTFINQDPSGDNSNGLDNVSLTLGQSTGVPESGQTVMLLGIGLAGLCWFRQTLKAN
jgi:Protein of unknown function (DUF642)